MAMTKAEMTTKNRRPVRDPIAGILSDWFGIEGAAAKILWALYVNFRPMKPIDLARTADVSQGSIWQWCSRLRAAGLEIPTAKRLPTRYTLTFGARLQVREALAHTMKLLGAEVPNLARIEALEEALGLTVDAPQEYGFTRAEAELYGLLTKTTVLSTERALAAMYGHRDDPPASRVIEVLICKIRRKLAPHGMKITTIWGYGYRLEKEPPRRAA